VITLRLETATPESWSAFGSIPTDEDSAAAPSRLEFLWDDGQVNFIGHMNSEISFGATGAARCELLNRHDTHTQTLMPMDADAYVVVVPAAVDFSDPSHFAQARAFMLPQHAVVHLDRGTWHWGPYPIGVESVRIFNIQGAGYVRDNGIAWLARDHGTIFEVDLRGV
jgi:ureidoglycolate hydrolase